MTRDMIKTMIKIIMIKIKDMINNTRRTLTMTKITKIFQKSKSTLKGR